MAARKEPLTLYGGEAKKAREIRRQLAESRGYDGPDDVARPDVFKHLLQHYDGPLDL